MRRRYFRLSALLVATLLIVSLGVTPVLAGEDVKPVHLESRATQVNQRATFQISFSGFAAFFRVASQLVSEAMPPSAPPLAFDPIDGEVNSLMFFLSKPRCNDDPDPGTPKMVDGCDPVG